MSENETICYCDSHLHLQDAAYGGDIAGLLDRARAVGVKLMVCNGTSPADWPAVRALAAEHDDIIPCYGVHPWFVDDLPDDWPVLLEQYLSCSAAAVGEIGLDRWKEPLCDELRAEVFTRQLHIANELSRPVIVHCLRAWDQLLAELKDFKPFEHGMLIHAFSGSQEIMKKLVDYNAYFSIAADALRPDREKLHQTLRQIPIERLLVETDSPDMLPLAEFRNYVPMKNAEGKKLNEPANLSAITAGLARIIDCDLEELAGTLWQNSLRFYKNQFYYSGN